MPRFGPRSSPAGHTSARSTRSSTSRSRTKTSRRTSAVPAPALVLVGIASVQWGAAIATTLFDDVGPGGTVMMRIVFAAVILVALWRPSLRGDDSRDLWVAGAFGPSLSGMKLRFFEAPGRVPPRPARPCEVL